MILLNAELQNNICKLKKDIIHIKTMEEIAELINCLSAQDINLNNLAEEICDVYIYLYRLRRIDSKKVRIKIKTNNIIYDIKSIIHTLSAFQQTISKKYLYNDYNDNEYYKYMDNVYNILYYLINTYSIDKDVEYWVNYKESRDSCLLRL